MRRETAWRVFAGEYLDSTLEIKGDGAKTPSYVVTPLGAKVNRLFIVGVLTDVENIVEGGDFIRAHLSDPTGVFTIYSGQFQKEVTEKLSTIEVPSFVALVGKIRTYTPEDSGTLYVSIRPETVYEVSAKIRDNWILETAWRTKERIEAFLEATKMNEPNARELEKLGYSRALSQGVIAAINHYPMISVDRYIDMIQDALAYIKPMEEEEGFIETEVEKPKDEGAKDSNEVEEKILEVIRGEEGEDGVSWETIIERCKTKGIKPEVVEEALNSLMDKGLIYEPVLGIIRTT
ncbi:MAG: hypothetical protein DRN12_06260 [Thermoplasmata archaeon]|nr:MAG: hypothetical protein DRN12_06260 [Thermoplasmata archaeon]